MNDQILLALFTKMLDEKLASLPIPIPEAGRRGPRGLPGADGNNFVFEDHVDRFRLLAKDVALKFSDLAPDEIQSLRGNPGTPGRPGIDGKDFVFDEHREEIKAFAKEFALKFSDLTDEEVELLRGPRGKDGKGFVFSEYEEKIKSWVEEFKLKFSDLKDDEVDLLRGPPGRKGDRGDRGEDAVFSFADHKEEITHILADVTAALRDDIKLKFSDLTEDEIEGLKGPRGQRGKPGRDFVFDEHKDFFLSLKPKFSDFTPEEKKEITLKFSDLSEDEVDSLKLKFENLNDEEKLSLRGARGQRGRSGRDGLDGKEGPRGLRGAPGPMGISGKSIVGRAGDPGLPGNNGLDAPVIIDIEILKRKDEFALRFSFSDGSEITSNYTHLGKITETISYVIGGVGGGGSSGNNSGGGGTGADGKSAYQIWLEQGNTGDEADFLASLVGPRGQSAYMAWIWLGNTGTPEDFIASLKGEKGDDGDKGDSGDAGEDGADGEDGKSAYEIWLDNGNVGTEQDFLNSLKGSPGSGGSVTYLDFPCETNVFIGSAIQIKKTNIVEVTMDEWSPLSEVPSLYSFHYVAKASLAKADSLENSNVLGIVAAKSSAANCSVMLPGGVTDAHYFGLDVESEYYLSPTDAGRLVPSSALPLTSGTIILKIGQPINETQLLISRGERKVVP